MFATSIAATGPKVAQILINSEEGGLIVEGLELPAEYRGERYAALDTEDGREAFGLKPGDELTLDVWKIAQLIPEGAHVGIFSHHAANPRTGMDLGGVVGLPSDDSFVVRNSLGDLRYLPKIVIDTFASTLK